MNNRLFVGNLAYSISDADLSDLFTPFGEVTSCRIATDRDTGRPRGFGFVEMQTQSDAEAAIRGLNGREIEGRQIAVNIAQPKPPRSTSGSNRRF
jgi:RNA recognition motif-containing protein